MIPVTRAIAGKSIGTTAALVPLTAYAIPFIARVFENSLRETDSGVIEAAKSFGATDMQIIWRVYIKESIPRLLNGVTLLIINMTIAGVSPDHSLVEAVENDNCDFFVAVQFHPEFKSRPNKAHPLFRGFVSAALKKISA